MWPATIEQRREMVARAMLNYLLNNFLIDCHQYNVWRGYNPNELKLTLVDEGIMKAGEYEELAAQLLAVAEINAINRQTSYLEYESTNEAVSDDFKDR